MHFIVCATYKIGGFPGELSSTQIFRLRGYGFGFTWLTPHIVIIIIGIAVSTPWMEAW
jgi:hypothetical protein